MSDQAEPEAMESKPPPGRKVPQLSSQVDDANDLRSFHFNRLINRWLTWVLAGLGMVAAAVAGFALAGPAIAGLALAAAFLLALLVVFFLADSASEDAFFDLYAKQRGMTRTEGGDLPPVTPLLRKGDERECDEILRGPLAESLEGTLALYTYTDIYYDKNGRHESNYHFTVAMADLPDSLRHVEELYCNRKVGFEFLEKVEDAFRTKERVRLESEALDDKYEIFVSKDQDPNWIRQLFSPTFIVWLTERTPEKFAFELENGVLCCNVSGHRKSAKDLDGMREASAAIAKRILEESLESDAVR